MNTPPIETERLILRRFTINDLEAIYTIFSDEEVNVFLPWFPVKSMEEAKSYFKDTYAKAYGQPCGYEYAACLKTDDIPIGYINISMNDSHDLGYGLRKEFWHKGITSEAAIAVVAQAKKDGIPFITATHDVNNPRSGSVMRAVGMTYQYSYEELWQPKNFPVVFRMYQLNLDGNDGRVYKAYWNKYANHFVEDL